MMQPEAKEYIEMLKGTPIDKISRANVEEGIKLLSFEVKLFNFDTNTSEEHSELLSCIKKLKRREQFAITNTYLSSSKIRHFNNQEILDALASELNKRFVEIKVDDKARNTETMLSEEMDKMKTQYSQIHKQLAKGLLQLEFGLSDLTFYTLMKHEPSNDETTSSELNNEMIKSLSKIESSRYVGSLILYVSQVKAAMPNANQLTSAFKSEDFYIHLDSINQQVNMMEVKLQEYFDKMSKQDLNPNELNDIVKDVANMQAKLDEVMSPLAEIIKKTAHAGKAGRFFEDYLFYEQPKKVLDAMGEDVLTHDLNKAKLKEKTTSRAEELAYAYKKAHHAKTPEKTVKKSDHSAVKTRKEKNKK